MIDFFALFLIFLITFVIAKRLKYIALRYSYYPSFSDIFYSYCLSVLFILFAEFNLLNIYVVFLSLLYILLFFDISLFQVYSINLDYSSMKLFLKDYKSYLNNKDETLINYIKYRRFYLFPFFSILIIVSFLSNFSFESFFIFSFFVYVLFVLAKIRFKKINVFLFIILSVFLSLFFSDINFDLLKLDYKVIFSIYIVLIIIKVFSKNIDTNFFKLDCKILDFFNVKSSLFIKPKSNYKNEENIVSLSYKSSNVNSKLEGSNVIFISIESLNKKIFKELLEEEKFEFLANTKVSSKHHFCISSNTYESLSTIYNGSYKEKEKSSFINILNDNSYKTVFYTPQSLAFENTIDLIKKNNFKKIISSDNYSENDSWINSDSEFYKTTYEILKNELKMNKYFLHILNSQTHLPYKVNKEHKSLSLKDKYKESLRESLFEIDYLLNSLKKDSLLNDTLIIFTGDHGESFGELEYNAHSTSVSKEQIDIPFFMIHEKLEKKELFFSNHFDIMPTVLSLLGLENKEKSLGRVVLELESEAFIAYSKTKMNKVPTSFAFINKEEKIFIDLMYQRFWITDLNDNIIKTLENEEKKEILWALYKAMENRQLIG